MIVTGFLLILTAFTAIGVFATESIDRPRRRKERLAGQSIAQ